MFVRRRNELHYKADAGAAVFPVKCHSRVIDVGKWKAGRWKGRASVTDRLAKCRAPGRPAVHQAHVITARRLPRRTDRRTTPLHLAHTTISSSSSSWRLPLIDSPSISTRYRRRMCFVSAVPPHAARNSRPSVRPSVTASVLTHQRLETRPDIKRSARRAPTDGGPGGAPPRRPVVNHSSSGPVYVYDRRRRDNGRPTDRRRETDADVHRTLAPPPQTTVADICCLILKTRIC